MGICRMLKEKVVTDVFDYAKLNTAFYIEAFAFVQLLFFTPPLCCQRVASFPITYLLLYIENLQYVAFTQGRP